MLTDQRHLLAQLVDNDGIKILWITKDRTSVRERLEELADDDRHPGTLRRTVGREAYLNLDSGGRIWFVPATAPNAIHGTVADLVFMDDLLTHPQLPRLQEAVAPVAIQAKLGKVESL